MKRRISMLLLLAFCLSFFASCENRDEKTDEETQTFLWGESTLLSEDWEYRMISLADGIYTTGGTDASKAALRYAQKTGSGFEYEYFRAMCGIAICVCVIEKYIEAPYADTEDGIVSAYFKTASLADYIAPYEEILLNAVRLLDINGFCTAEISAEEMLSFCHALPYGVMSGEQHTVLGLMFSGIDTMLADYARLLLPLVSRSAFYSAHMITAEDERLLKALIEACEGVAEKRSVLYCDWVKFYTGLQKDTGISVSEEFVLERDTVRITIAGDGIRLYAPVSADYIENFADFVDGSGAVLGRDSLVSLPMTIELPVFYYTYHWEDKTDFELKLRGYDENNLPIEEKTSLSVDPRLYYPETPLRLQDVFWDGILTSVFGEDYSERDLLSIYSMQIAVISHGGEPYFTITLYWKQNGKNMSRSFYYSDYGEGDIPERFTEEFTEALRHFHGLTAINVAAPNRYTLPDALLEEILPYRAAVEAAERKNGG